MTGNTDVHGWAMTEQIRTISRRRLAHPAGAIDDEYLTAIRTWMGDFLNLP